MVNLYGLLNKNKEGERNSFDIIMEDASVLYHHFFYSIKEKGNRRCTACGALGHQKNNADCTKHNDL
jgi:hypothetical protein